MVIFIISICCCKENNKNNFYYNDELIKCLSDDNVYIEYRKYINIFISKNDSEKIIIPLYLLRETHIVLKDSFQINSYKEFLKKAIRQELKFKINFSTDFISFKIDSNITNEYKKGGKEILLNQYFFQNNLENGLSKFEFKFQKEKNTMYSIFYYLFLEGYIMFEQDLGKSQFSLIHIKDYIDCPLVERNL